jgi:hypothetical protein
MNKIQLTWLIVISAILAFYPAAHLNAQSPAGEEKRPDVEIRKFRVESATVAGGDKPWLRLLVDFGSRPDWADGIVFYYDVLLQSGNEYRVISGTARYSNVKRGLHTAVLFMSPSAVERFGSPVAAFVRSSYKDQPAGEINWEADGKNPPDGWANQFQRYSNQLLPITLTPFVASEYGKYPDAMVAR